MGVADTTAPASFGTASDLRTAATHPASHSADSPWLPLTTNARGIYFAAAIDPENPCYNTAEVLQCPADTDLTLLREAFEQLYRENEGFRVRTRIADGAASQQILTEEAFLAGIDLLVDEGELDGGELEESELSGTAKAEEENASDLPESALPDSDLPAPVRAWAQRLLAQPLTTDEGVTVRSAVARYGGFLWVYHSFSHVVADGFAAFNGLSRVAAIYRALSAGQPVPATRRMSLQQLLDADDAASTARDEDVAFWEAGGALGDAQLAELVAAGVAQIVVRSVLTCESQVGTCAKCYGRSLATGKQVDIGEAVGIIAAQSIGEPGTQLTMRTFHTGGAASAADITQGLPRVQELFEARSPKVEAKMNEAAGRVHIDDEDPSARKVIITRDDGKEDLVIEVSRRQKLLVSEGQHIAAGTPLTEGQLDPKEILRIMGRNVAQKMLVDEVQKVYRDQGVGIHAKHIEVIVRQMLRRVTILEPGDTTFMPGELVDRMAYLTQNRRVASEGGQPASGRQMLMGITKASLATDSWLSAASFQETTKVLTEAAMNGKSDSLVGLKENVILGKLIPAGTGLSRYNDVIVEPTAEAMANSNYSEADFGDGSVSEDFLDALGAIDFGMNFRE